MSESAKAALSAATILASPGVALRPRLEQGERPLFAGVLAAMLGQPGVRMPVFVGTNPRAVAPVPNQAALRVSEVDAALCPPADAGAGMPMAGAPMAGADLVSALPARLQFSAAVMKSLRAGEPSEKEEGRPADPAAAITEVALVLLPLEPAAPPAPAILTLTPGWTAVPLVSFSPKVSSKVPDGVGPHFSAEISPAAARWSATAISPLPSPQGAMPLLAPPDTAPQPQGPVFSGAAHSADVVPAFIKVPAVLEGRGATTGFGQPPRGGVAEQPNDRPVVAVAPPEVTAPGASPVIRKPRVAASDGAILAMDMTESAMPIPPVPGGQGLPPVITGPFQLSVVGAQPPQPALPSVVLRPLSGVEGARLGAVSLDRLGAAAPPVTDPGPARAVEHNRRLPEKLAAPAVVAPPERPMPTLDMEPPPAVVTAPVVAVAGGASVDTLRVEALIRPGVSGVLPAEAVSGNVARPVLAAPVAPGLEVKQAGDPAKRGDDPPVVSPARVGGGQPVAHFIIYQDHSVYVLATPGREVKAGAEVNATLLPLQPLPADPAISEVGGNVSFTDPHSLTLESVTAPLAATTGANGPLFGAIVAPPRKEVGRGTGEKTTSDEGVEVARGTAGRPRPLAAAVSMIAEAPVASRGASPPAPALVTGAIQVPPPVKPASGAGPRPDLIGNAAALGVAPLPAEASRSSPTIPTSPPEKPDGMAGAGQRDAKPVLLTQPYVDRPEGTINDAGPQQTTTVAGIAFPQSPGLPVASTATRTEPVSRSASGVPVEQVIPLLISAARSATPERVTVHLTPQDLGRVEIQIDRPADGPAMIVLSVQRPETLALLQADQSRLHDALDRAGIDSDQRVITLALAADLRGPGVAPVQPHQAPQDAPDRAAGSASPAFPPQGEAAPASFSASSGGGGGGQGFQRQAFERAMPFGQAGTATDMAAPDNGTKPDQPRTHGYSGINITA